MKSSMISKYNSNKFLITFWMWYNLSCLDLYVDYCSNEHPWLNIWPKNFSWVNFTEFHELFVSNEKLETYALEHYPNLTHFFISWSSYRKHKFLVLVGLKRTPPSVWRLGPWRIGLKWVHQCMVGPCNDYHNVLGVHHWQTTLQHIWMCHESNKVEFLVPFVHNKIFDPHNLSFWSPQQCKKFHNHNQFKHQHNNNAIFPY
jgi:hypothetical protein